MDLSIERADYKDIPKLIEVQNKSFYEDYVLYGECPAYNESEEKMRSYIENRKVYKILLDDGIVGDIIVRERENKNYFLRVLAVIPEAQNLGIGTEAIKHIEMDNADALEWELVTPEKSLRNHHFYEKMGYIKIGETMQSEVLALWKYKKVL